MQPNDAFWYKMKRNIVIPVIAIVLMAFFAGPYILILLVVIPFAYFINKCIEKTKAPRVIYEHVEDVEQKYGEPDDVVVLDASRANELPALILFFIAQDIMIVAGEEMKLSDLVSVMPKNMATPYTVDEYAVILTTKDPHCPTIQLRVGYDGGLAQEIAAQIYSHISQA